MVTRGAVLCGGEGTRLRPLIKDRQKTMIEIGPHRRPLLEYIVRLLAYHGVTSITLLTGYRSEEIEKHFDHGDRFGVHLTYSKDPIGLNGSAHSLAHALEKGTVGEFDELLVYYGDILSALNVRDLLEHHRSKGSDLTLVLTKDYRLPVGVAQVADGRVVSFSEKPTMELKTTIGCLVMSKKTVPVLEDVTAGGGRDIMTNFVPTVIARGLKVSPFYLDGFWQDIGTLEAYEKLDDKIIVENLRFLG
jgi:mannose-1-phosphate guanylyltransferase